MPLSSRQISLTLHPWACSVKTLKFIKCSLAAVTLLASSLLAVGVATAATPDGGAIARKYASLGSARGYLGPVVTPLRCGLVGNGCYQAFKGGSIYWSAATGAHPTKGGIGGKWAQMGYEKSPLGYPATDEVCTGASTRTCTQRYQLGAIGWTAAKGTSVTPTAGSIALVVNKRRPNTPLNGSPADLTVVGNQYMRREAATALVRLSNAAAAAGVQITTVSGFRSYAAQAALYNSYVAQYGRNVADTISARPGYSEHQTGLAMDIGNPNGACSLAACFANTPAGAYAARNAWRYGFIVRYPNGYSSITGYTYEPWHLRYVGVPLATDMHNRSARTLEQYLGLAAAPNY